MFDSSTRTYLRGSTMVEQKLLPGMPLISYNYGKTGLYLTNLLMIYICELFINFISD